MKTVFDLSKEHLRVLVRRIEEETWDYIQNNLSDAGDFQYEFRYFTQLGLACMGYNDDDKSVDVVCSFQRKIRTPKQLKAEMELEND